MVESDPDSHIDEEQDGEPSHGLKITGEEGIGDSAEAQEEQNSCGGTHCSLVKDGNVDALNFVPKVKVFFSRACHGTSIPQGVLRDH